MTPPPLAASLPPPRRRARPRGATALLGTLAQTLALLRWLLAGLVGIYLASGLTRVAPHEGALIYRLGRLQPEVHGPGLLFALPAPVDRVVRVPVRAQRDLVINAWSPEDEPAAFVVLPSSPLPGPPPSGRPPGLHPVHHGYTLTGDVNLVQARFAVRYRIADPVAWLRAAESGTAERLIESAILSAATAALAGTPVDPALSSGLESFRERVRAAAQERVARLGLGVELAALEVASLAPPAATAAHFADVTSAQVEARTMRENASTYAARLLPNAHSEAFRLRQEAEAAGRARVARASAEAASFTALAAEHAAAPELVRARLRAEALAAVAAQTRARTAVPADGHLNLFLRDRP